MKFDVFADPANHILLARVAAGVVTRDWLRGTFIQGERVTTPVSTAVAVFDAQKLLVWSRIPGTRVARAALTDKGARALGFFDMQAEDRPLPVRGWAW